MNKIIDAIKVLYNVVVYLEDYEEILELNNCNSCGDKNCPYRPRWGERGRRGYGMDEEIRQALTEVQEMKKMCGNISMKLTNIVTQRGQDWKKKLEAEYQRGLSEGNDIGYKDGVKDGQNEAWEAARKIALMDTETSENVTGYFGLFRIMENLTPMQAIEKLKAYEEKQKTDDEIKVGDEVIYNNTQKCLVVRPESNDKYATLIDSNGNHHHACHSECKKTGRHFDIASILKEMQS